ncbi:hypothetical protein B0H19DRAFT_1162192 [Mycena capillaripes]|nr:hypothetical protein B0H19DRAFT_1162192 [Mycena capillaripes]
MRKTRLGAASPAARTCRTPRARALNLGTVPLPLRPRRFHLALCCANAFHEGSNNFTFQRTPGPRTHRVAQPPTSTPAELREIKRNLSHLPHTETSRGWKTKEGGVPPAVETVTHPALSCLYGAGRTPPPRRGNPKPCRYRDLAETRPHRPASVRGRNDDMRDM